MQYYKNEQNWIAYDAYLTAAILNRSIVEKEAQAKVRIELFDPENRGKMFVDENEPTKVKIITKLNTDLFKTTFYQTISNIKIC